MIIVYSLIALLITYPYLLFLQENHYHKNSFIKIIPKEIRRKENILLIFPLLALFYQSIYIKISIIIVLIIYSVLLLKKKTILKLKFTKRIIRIITLEAILIVLLSFITNVLVIYLSYFICMISYFLLLPLERLINHYYHVKAKKKINKIKPLVIGITGSYGKTTCKTFLYQLLKDTYRTYKTPLSYNTANSIAMSIEKMNELTEVFIVEYGASKVNDIKESLKIVSPDISLITTIDNQHLETFKTIDNIIKEKTRIIAPSKVHFYNVNKKYDDNLFDSQLESYSFSISQNADYKISNIYKEKGKTYFSFIHQGKEEKFETKLTGKANLINLCACLGICDYLHISYNKLKRIVRNIKGEKARLEIIKKNEITIINDSFNSNRFGFVEAIDILNSYVEEKILITPGVVTGGKEMGKNNIELAKILAKMDIKIILEQSIVSKLYENVFKSENKDYILVDSFKEAYKEATKNEGKKVILIENDITDIYK